ncbi:hypothetical protein A3Q05_06520 [Lactobacillus johnsonii]|uniref:Fic/DOC family protein n=1 Tax=Lactobacillus johnsonii TaxID=33959 RepID=UPI000BA3482D|nr:Fic family protein [Lactobacillus johnsonii]PAB54622.1 hypothetical protein A3Q05_06520 [Lactobacillus johnsonii]PEG69543.1 cell filamentation protein Fic [Lactobacillus johnsonii]
MSKQEDDQYHENRFLYKNGTLKNKLGIKNTKDLSSVEYLGSASRALVLIKKQPEIRSINELQAIHKVMFGWLYDWAGKIRDYDLSKNGYGFLEGDRQEFGIQNINNKINQKNELDTLNNKDYAELLDELNYLHPFREGNGRSTKLFLQCFAANHEQVLDYPRKNNEMIEAQNNADIDKISELIQVQNSPSREAAFQQLKYLQTNSMKKEKARLAALERRRRLER